MFMHLRCLLSRSAEVPASAVTAWQAERANAAYAHFGDTAYWSRTLRCSATVVSPFPFCTPGQVVNVERYANARSTLPPFASSCAKLRLNTCALNLKGMLGLAVINAIMMKLIRLPGRHSSFWRTLQTPSKSVGRASFYRLGATSILRCTA